MPVEISQLRPEGLQAAIDFAKGAGFECDAKTVDTGVSLIAKEGETPVAVVLGVHTSGSSFSLEVCLGKVDDPAAITQELIDKVLMKVKGAGLRRCQINYHGPDAVSSSWPDANWIGQADTGSDPKAENRKDVIPAEGADSDAKDDAKATVEADAPTDAVVNSDTHADVDADTHTDVNTGVDTEAA